jgi:tetratricopeptide (TPR) repeat protein
MAVLTLLHAGQSASELGKWQECVRFLDQIPAKSPDPYYLAEALVERGRAKQSLNRIDEALQDYEQAATMSRGEAGARARFFIGEIQYQRKEFDQAISTFQRVMYTYGGENAAGEVKHWQAMAGFEAGRCAEVQIDLARDSQARGQYLADARKFYSFVVDGHPKHEFAPQARRRLDALAKLSLSSGKRQGTR